MSNIELGDNEKWKEKMQKKDSSFETEVLLMGRGDRNGMMQLDGAFNSMNYLLNRISIK
jgi:hypothetical protein